MTVVVVLVSLRLLWTIIGLAALAGAKLSGAHLGSGGIGLGIIAVCPEFFIPGTIRWLAFAAARKMERALDWIFNQK